MSGARRLGIVGAIALCAVTFTFAQQPATPVNEASNPYRTIENYFKMPAGRTWGSTSAVEIDRDGRSIWVAERCGANTCLGSDLDTVLNAVVDKIGVSDGQTTQETLGLSHRHDVRGLALRRRS